MSRGLIGDEVDLDLACLVTAQNLGEHLCRVADESDRPATVLIAGLLHLRECLVEVFDDLVEVALACAAIEAGLVDVDDEAGAVVQGHGEGLCAAHATATAGQGDSAGERALTLDLCDAALADELAACCGEGLVGALQNALGADVDPRAGGHLAVHHEALGLELAKLWPGCPVADEVRVREQHAGRPLVRAEDADRLARLHEQGLVFFEVAQGVDDRVEGLPAACRTAGATVDHEVVGALGNLGVEIVHEHAKRCLGLPALRADLSAARCANGACAGKCHGDAFRL